VAAYWVWAGSWQAYPDGRAEPIRPFGLRDAGRAGSGQVLTGVRCAAHSYDRLVILRCTKKLLAVLGAGRVAEPGPAPDAEDWYANLLWFDRRKCLLLAHAATLFSIFEADVGAVDLRATHRLVAELVERELRREGLPPATFGNLRSQELILAKTAACWGA